MEPAEIAVLKTVLYADLFDYPLRVDELRRGLFDVALDVPELRRVLDTSLLLRTHIEEREGFVFVAGRNHLIERRRIGERNAQELRVRFGTTLDRIARLPFVRLVAISGAVAFSNAHDDDVDLLVVASRERAWTACLLVTVIARLLGVRRAICANYFLDETALELPDRDLYTAHQLVNLEPFRGDAAFGALLSANAWARGHFPAGYDDARNRRVEPIRVGTVRTAIERMTGQLLERLSHRVLAANLRRKVPVNADPASVRLNRDRLKLHINDHRAETLGRFEQALAERLCVHHVPPRSLPDRVEVAL